MPRRTAETGVDKAAGYYENLRIQYDGDAVLTGKNEADNALFDQFTSTGDLRDWVVDNAPEEHGIYVYGKAPGQTRFTRQGTLALTDPYHDQKSDFIDAELPPDQTNYAAVAPFLVPPHLSLQAIGYVGFKEGWWAVAYRYAVKLGGKGGVKKTNTGPPGAIFLEDNQGLRIPMEASPPEGLEEIHIGMNGPFATEIEALNTMKMYKQKEVKAKPRLPFSVDLKGPFKKSESMSFIKNETFAGAGGGDEKNPNDEKKNKNKKKTKKKKRRRPGRTQSSRTTTTTETF